MKENLKEFWEELKLGLLFMVAANLLGGLALLIRMNAIGLISIAIAIAGSIAICNKYNKYNK